MGNRYDDMDKQPSGDWSIPDEPRKPKIALTLVVLCLALIAAGVIWYVVDSSLRQGEAIRNGAPIQVADSEAQSTINDLQRQVAEQKGRIDELERTNTAVIQENTDKQAQLDQLTADHATLQENYDYVSDAYNNSDQWRDRYDDMVTQFHKEAGWHLYFGGLATVKLDELDKPSASLLFGAGPSKWQVIGGVGYGLDQDISVSIGVLYRF